MVQHAGRFRHNVQQAAGTLLVVAAADRSTQAHELVMGLVSVQEVAATLDEPSRKDVDKELAVLMKDLLTTRLRKTKRARDLTPHSRSCSESAEAA